MLATPDVSGPIRLIKPEAFYLFADEDLESLSAGQKVLLRMGPENAARIKAKLAEPLSQRVVRLMKLNSTPRLRAESPLK